MDESDHVRFRRNEYEDVNRPEGIGRPGLSRTYIIGAGRFGSRAARILSEGGGGELLVVDRDESRLSELRSFPLKTVVGEGVRFLLEHLTTMDPMSLIVPAVPVHLAAEWVKGFLGESCSPRELMLPGEIYPLLPLSWPLGKSSLLVSYADFLCPENCPEPPSCTVTGECREALHAVLGRLSVPGYKVHVVRSLQLAPGLGGYPVQELLTLGERIVRERPSDWLLATACRCHGVLSAMGFS